MELNAYEVQPRVPPLLRRCVIGSTGMLVGVVTMLPNAMMADYNPKGAGRGMAASALFLLGGFLGCGCNRWEILLHGLIMQVVAFAGYPPVLLGLGFFMYVFRRKIPEWFEHFVTALAS